MATILERVMTLLKVCIRMQIPQLARFSADLLPSGESIARNVRGVAVPGDAGVAERIVEDGRRGSAPARDSRLGRKRQNRDVPNSAPPSGLSVASVTAVVDAHRGPRGKRGSANDARHIPPPWGRCMWRGW